jgi:hypothetical protein
MHMLMSKDTEGILTTKEFHLRSNFLVFTRQRMKLILSKCFWAVCKELVINIKMIRKPKIPHLYNYLLHRCGELYMIKIYILSMIRGVNMLKKRPFCHLVWTYAELSSIMYEASLTQDSINNSQNSHICYHRNPPNSTATNFQRRFSVKVQCGVYGNKSTTVLWATHALFLRNELSHPIDGKG